MKSVVTVDNVSKKFCRSLKRGMIYTAMDVGRDMIGQKGKQDTLRPEEFWALKNISFELKAGASLGLLGVNGAGKSTLLKVLNGIIRPDNGQIRMRGRVGALIEVGAGFHPMLSGRENIYINGAILGMRKREIDRKYDAIVAFSELDPRVLEAPVKSYSSGMYVRLGFSVAIHSDPEILLIDEVLSVGDLGFTGKCRKRLQEMRASGVTFLLVSHHLPTVEAICDQAILIENGQVVEHGPTRRATTRLRMSIGGPNNQASNKARAQKLAQGDARKGAITAVTLLNDAGRDIHSEREVPVGMPTIPCGSQQTIAVTLDVPTPMTEGMLMVWLVRSADDLVACCGHIHMPAEMPPLKTGRLNLSLPFTPYPGEYRLGVTLAGAGPLDIIDEAYSDPFEIVAGPAMPTIEIGDGSVGVCAVRLRYLGK